MTHKMITAMFSNAGQPGRAVQADRDPGSESG